MDKKKIIKKLIDGTAGNNYRGWDVFDGLKSRKLKSSALFNSKYYRLFWQQVFKRSPVNLRSIFDVPKGLNAKGAALFLRGFLNLYRLEKKEQYLTEAYQFADRIIAQRATDREYFCVGYDFFWQSRVFSAEAFSPNIIVSSFTGQAFLDLYEIDNDPKWLDLVEQIGLFIKKELIILDNEKELCFGYVPGETAVIHNANLLGACLFARLYKLTEKNDYRELALRASSFSVTAQKENGSWYYGESAHHKWVDNFHTGFNLVALKDIMLFLNTDIWEKDLKKGYEFHRDNHFKKDMTPKYYDRKSYPIDIHNFAQGIITFTTFGQPDLAEKIYLKALSTFWDKEKNYFYYQRTRLYRNKINYIRWAQAWMFYALSKSMEIGNGSDD